MKAADPREKDRTERAAAPGSIPAAPAPAPAPAAAVTAAAAAKPAAGTFDSNKAADLRMKVKVVALIGARLARYGAETRLILNSMDQLARYLHLDKAQCGFDSQGTKVTCEGPSGQVFYYAKVTHYGINMAAVSEYHRICLKAARGDYQNLRELHDDVIRVQPKTYPRPLITAVECLAACAFCFLNHGGPLVCLCAAFGALLLMLTRFALQDWGYFESFRVMAAAFAGGLGATAAAALLHLPFAGAALAVLSTSLLLVPGFPMITGFLDVFKGYTSAGLLRLSHALIIITYAAFGIIGASYMGSRLFY